MTQETPAPPAPLAPAPAELLFEEARRRRRRIRTAATATVAAAALLAGTALLAVTSQGPANPAAGRDGASPAGGAGPAPHEVAWVDYANRLLVGDLRTGVDRVVATVEASPLTPLVSAGGRLFVVDTAGAYVRRLGHWSEVVDAVDPATGAVRMAEPGDGVFASADGRRLFFPQAGDTTLLAASVSGRGPTVTYRLPRGWFVPSGSGLAVGRYVVVQSNDSGAVGAPGALGLWDPSTGRVRVLARARRDTTAAAPDLGVLGATTPPGGGHPLLAWLSPGCRPTAPCPLEITDVSTMRTRTVHSPLGYGFAPGGALSPDGRSLVAFALGPPGAGTRPAEVVVVDPARGTVRPVPGASVALGQVAAWASVVGDADALAGTAQQAYRIDLASLTARPVVFGTARGAGTPPDFSTVPLGPGR